MPPKKNEPSKKTQEKKKDKVIEVCLEKDSYTVCSTRVIAQGLPLPLHIFRSKIREYTRYKV